MMTAKERAALAQLEAFKQDTLRKRQELENSVAIQTRDGNWNADRYMHGMANGMIFAQSIMNGNDPDYYSAPPRYLLDSEPTTDECARDMTSTINMVLGGWIDAQMKAGRVSFDEKQIADVRTGIALALADC